MRTLFTGLDVEFHLYEGGWNWMLRQLSKMPITHLGLTVKVGYPAKSVRGHDCFINQFTAIKTLKSFSLNLASYQVSQKANKEIEEKLREKLIKGYVTKEKKKILKLKRSVAEDGANAMELKRRAKRPSMKVSSLPCESSL